MREVSGFGLLGAWMKSRRAVLIYFTVFVLILFIVYSLYGLPMGTAGYAALLGTVTGAGFAFYDYIRYVSRHAALEKMAGRFPIGSLPPTQDLIARDYSRIIMEQERERLRLIAENERGRSDAGQYYTLWAHQVKTPISAMRLLLQKGGEKAAPASLETELFRIEQYVDMALQYQRLESLNSDLMFQTHKVDTLVRQAVKNLAPLFINKNLPLSISATERTVVTDSKWFVFVLEQIMTNAIKYTREGSISVALTGDVLVIADTGMGIPPEDLPRVFERGYTGAAGRSERHATGIGLYLCREIITRLGLSLSLDSRLGQGTEVRIGLMQNKYAGEDDK